jgi:hypothetical protein
VANVVSVSREQDEALVRFDDETFMRFRPYRDAPGKMISGIERIGIEQYGRIVFAYDGRSPVGSTAPLSERTIRIMSPEWTPAIAAERWRAVRIFLEVRCRIAPFGGSLSKSEPPSADEHYAFRVVTRGTYELMQLERFAPSAPATP